MLLYSLSVLYLFSSICFLSTLINLYIHTLLFNPYTEYVLFFFSILIQGVILTFASKYLVKYKRYGKMFSMKVLLLRGGHKMIPLA